MTNIFHFFSVKKNSFVNWLNMQRTIRIISIKLSLQSSIHKACLVEFFVDLNSFPLATFHYLALFCIQIYAPRHFVFLAQQIFLCDEREKVFPFQPRLSKVTKLNPLLVLLLPVHNILLPIERLVAVKQRTCSRARDVLSSNKSMRKMG